MVARAAVKHCQSIGDEVIALTRRELDIADAKQVEEIFRRELPDAVINCAAYTDVDGAALVTLRARADDPWVAQRIDAGLKQAFRQDPAVSAMLPSLLEQVGNGRLPASTAARNLLAAQSGRAQAAIK